MALLVALPLLLSQLLLAGGATADRSMQRAALAGIAPFTVETEFAPTTGFGQAVDAMRLRADVESALRQGGVPIADRERQPNAPFLALRFEGACTPFGCNGVVALRLNWLADSSEPLAGALKARTFLFDSRPVYSYREGLTNDVDAVLKPMVDAFVADYHAANPAVRGSGAP